ncbi:MAG TPA: ubiquinone/menaquinone biosynthesis methyltransferase [Verrucomicrobiae bacterium]|jgi:demethylmenaquinone methyltransferase/2-methoxy-6-polyprenyl-1,4-benzoquinol methylase
MANKYYQPGEGRAAKVNDLFAAIASRYDLINDLQSFGLHRGWKRRLVRLADPQPGERALDLCCGTGDIAFGLARRGAEVVGLDFSEAMLGVAREKGRRQKAEGRRNGSVVFEQGDVMQLPFSDGLFDIVTVGYGLRNLASWERGLAEMHRVARPGGRLLVLDFGKPDDALWRRLYFSYLRWFVPFFGKIFCGDSATHAYILESLQHYPGPRGVEAGMNDLKCAEVRVINLLGGIMSINYGIRSCFKNHS